MLVGGMEREKIGMEEGEKIPSFSFISHHVFNEITIFNYHMHSKFDSNFTYHPPNPHFHKSKNNLCLSRKVMISCIYLYAPSS